MPRLIFKCPHIKGGASVSAAHLGNYVRYVSTREGAERLGPKLSAGPATQKQQEMVGQLVREFPLSKGLFEYEDYQAAPTRENASAFIGRAIEDNLDQMAKKENYLSYIARRPRAERVGAHALFTGTDQPLVLSQVMEEVAHHPGAVWLPILSLRREDAARLGYDNAARWRELLSAYAPKMAEAMRIPWSEFRWYAAYHDEGHHPHVHMVCYSADGKSGFLSRKGIAEIKNALAAEIFRQDLTEIYQRQTVRRDELTVQARERLTQLIGEMQTGTLENQRIGALMSDLADRLKTVKGKKQYGYLKPQLRAVVDEIVDELARDPRVAEAYDLWYELREEVLRTYKNDLPDRAPLSQQKEFKQIRNMVIREAAALAEAEVTMERAPAGDEPVEAMEPPQIPEAPSPEPLSQELPSPELPSQEPPPNRGGEEHNKMWTERYQQARTFLYGADDQPSDYERAHALLLEEARDSNPLAMCDLGRMCADGLGCEADREQARQWYAEALTTFLDAEEREPDRYVEYRIGKLYAGGLGAEQDDVEAARWFTKAAEQGHKYAQYSLAGLYLRGQSVAQDDIKAYRLYVASAEKGFPYAAFELGKLLQSGRGCEQDVDAAQQWFRQACQGFTTLERQSHDDKLQYRLGWMLLHGVGVARDESAAREWFEKSARLGNTNAQYQLAKLILAEDGPDPEQIQQAVDWLTRAAEAGHDYAQYALGKLYRDGVGVERDLLKAVIWFNAAAEQGNDYAAYALGKLFLSDEAKDISAALEWLGKAAGRGNEYAQYTLGKLYLTGQDVPEDVPKAVEYLTAAAEQGNQYAQYQLGKLYLLGRDMEQDRDAAERWFRLSANQGNEYAQWFLDHWDEFSRTPTLLQCAASLLQTLGRLFEEQTPLPVHGIQFPVDGKLRRRIREKKIAMGHKPDDHEDQVQTQSV